MQTRVQKWDNSLAIQIPKCFAAEVGLDQDSEVKLSLVDGTLVLVPIVSQPLTLAALLRKITATNMHTEISTGDAVENENW